MTQRSIHVRLPELDGPGALQLIGILDAIVAELWIHYGDVLFGEATAAACSPELDQSGELDETSDLPF